MPALHHPCGPLWYHSEPGELPFPPRAQELFKDSADEKGHLFRANHKGNQLTRKVRVKRTRDRVALLPSLAGTQKLAAPGVPSKVGKWHQGQKMALGRKVHQRTLTGASVSPGGTKLGHSQRSEASNNFGAKHCGRFGKSAENTEDSGSPTPEKGTRKRAETAHSVRNPQKAETNSFTMPWRTSRVSPRKS